MVSGWRSHAFSPAKRKSAQEFLHILYTTAGALQACNPQCILSAGDSQRVVEHFAGPSASLRRQSIENFQPLAAHFAPGTRLGRKTANKAIDVARCPRPIDSGLVLRNFPRVRCAFGALRLFADRATFECCKRAQ